MKTRAEELSARSLRHPDSPAVEASQTPSTEVISPGAESRWYWVAATFKAVHPNNPQRKHLWERIVFLMHLPDASDIQAAAYSLASKKEHSYTSATDELVSWELQHIEAIEELMDDVLSNGAEVYWTFFNKVDRSPGSAPADRRPPSS